jgi:hypothetical protein
MLHVTHAPDGAGDGVGVGEGLGAGTVNENNPLLGVHATWLFTTQAICTGWLGIATSAEHLSLPVLSMTFVGFALNVT